MPTIFPIAEPVETFHQKYLKAKQAFLEGGVSQSPEGSPFANMPLTQEGVEYNAGIGNKIAAMLFEGLLGGAPGSPEMLQSGAMNAFAMPIAYHGTPYPFDKFSTAYIGKGQGAQSYGHGLYFAENPSVAKQYQMELASAPSKVQFKYKGKLLSDNMNITDPEELAAWYYHKYGGVAPTYLQDTIDTMKSAGVNPEIELKASNYLKEGYIDTFHRNIENLPGGYTYKTDIKPPAEKFLDWDKPLSEQSEGVRKALPKLIGDAKIDPFESPGLAVLTGGRHPRDPKWVPTGQDILNELADIRGLHRNTPEVSKMLQDAGIPGIRYLDQGSRGAGAGKGTYNYVVFSDKDVKILERK